MDAYIEISTMAVVMWLGRCEDVRRIHFRKGFLTADRAGRLDPPCYHWQEPRRRPACSMLMKRLRLLALMLASLVLATRGFGADDTVPLNFVNADIDAGVRAGSELPRRAGE